MAKRSSRKLRGPKHRGPQPARTRFDMERDLAELNKVLMEQEFENVEDINQFLQEYLEQTGGRLPRSEPETPLERAQELVYQAMDASPRKAKRLAKKALSISPDCADAYLVLADLETEDHVRKLELCREAVAAGERAIGPENFEEMKGHFWAIVETRPYMRALMQLSEALWRYGEVEESLALLYKMLELNPGDNQGARYTLLDNLLLLWRNDEAEALLERYDDVMAHWLYNRALLYFRKYGRSEKANVALEEALDQNQWVSLYLLGAKELPPEMPDHYGYGDENEAILYTESGFVLWLMTPGSHLWLMDIAEKFFG